MGGGMVAERKDAWASGHAYEPYVGRWSRLVARQFVDWLRVPPSSDWIDVGCGTGALCEVILASASPRQVTGIDPSDGFVAFARKTVADPRASFRAADAQKLPLASHSFEARCREPHVQTASSRPMFGIMPARCR